MDNEVIQIVQTKIYSIRDKKVMLDYDLAELYGVETKRINEAVKNNPEKFPEDFWFELNDEEFKNLRSKFSTTKLSKTRAKPKAFTEQGVYMLATILKSSTATKITVAIMRAFVKLRHFAFTYEDIIKKLNDLDVKVENHDKVLKDILNALSELLMEAKENETKRIGFKI
jgi:hypothetical protein